jgi:hypothetical protein
MLAGSNTAGSSAVATTAPARKPPHNLGNVAHVPVSLPSCSFPWVEALSGRDVRSEVPKLFQITGP